MDISEKEMRTLEPRTQIHILCDNIDKLGEEVREVKQSVDTLSGTMDRFLYSPWRVFMPHFPTRTYRIIFILIISIVSSLGVDFQGCLTYMHVLISKVVK
jgi:hypothetical protein